MQNNRRVSLAEKHLVPKLDGVSPFRDTVLHTEQLSVTHVCRCKRNIVETYWTRTKRYFQFNHRKCLKGGFIFVVLSINHSLSDVLKFVKIWPCTSYNVIGPCFVRALLRLANYLDKSSFCTYILILIHFYVKLDFTA